MRHLNLRNSWFLAVFVALAALMALTIGIAPKALAVGPITVTPENCGLTVEVATGVAEEFQLAAVGGDDMFPLGGRVIIPAEGITKSFAPLPAGDYAVFFYIGGVNQPELGRMATVTCSTASPSPSESGSTEPVTLTVTSGTECDPTYVANAWLHVESTPAATATVVINGETRTATTPITFGYVLPDGSYPWTASVPGAATKTGTLVVKCAAGGFTSVSPKRLLDTRITGPKLGSAMTRPLQVTGVGGVPTGGVSAVVLNVTVTDTTSGGYLTVSPTGTTRPVVSNLNWSAGATIPNAVTVKVGTDGSIDLYQSGPGTANVIVDVAGYYIDGTVTTAGGFTSVAPARILDTRTGTGKLASAESRDLQILGQGGVPESNVSAVVLNVTVTDTNAVGYLTVFPSGTTRPTASNLNWNAGVTVPNLVTVKVGDNGKVSLFQSGPGTTNVIVDVAGYYLGGTPTQPGMFVAISPARVLDTRSSSPCAGGTDLPLTILNSGGIPASGVSAVVLNTTVTDTTMGGYLTVFPGTNVAPTASNLNWSSPNATTANLVTVQVGGDGSIKFHNGSPGRVNVIVDTAGYYLS